ncbi:MAG: transcriptional regulator [Ruminococcus sp.]|nr:transcriptional regulator [Ruminococcus sp.]MDE6678808.1 transcriptional regulator [Ruminococcus sp.]
MYNINDAVVYGSNGVCVITAIEERDFSGENVEYYILQPVNNSKNTFYVPTSNYALKNKMRSIYSRKEIDSLISSMGDECSIWIDDNFQRKEEYRKIIDKGDRRELVRLIKTLWQKNIELGQKHKKLHSTDERFLKDAENILYSEFAYSLDIPVEEVVDYIRKHV